MLRRRQHVVNDAQDYKPCLKDKTLVLSDKYGNVVQADLHLCIEALPDISGTAAPAVH